MFQVFAIYNTFDLYAQVLIIILKPETLNKDVMIFTKPKNQTLIVMTINVSVEKRCLEIKTTY